MNDRSSRSHAVFSVSLTHTTVSPDHAPQPCDHTPCIQVQEEDEHNTVSRINIIDLAGSERSKVADTSGERLKVCGVL